MGKASNYYEFIIDEITSGEEGEFKGGYSEFELDVDIFLKYNSKKNLKNAEWDDWLELNILDNYTIDPFEKKPSDISLKTIKYFIENEEKIIENLCKEICNNEKLIDIYEEYSPEFDNGIPTYENHKLATRHFMINGVNIFEEEKNGFKYVGFTGNCNWNPEYGFGCVIHKDKIMLIGNWNDGYYFNDGEIN
ncbi:DUF6985 domain-containing protein [Aureivirga marina]|uniref:DUF6985 domain-containing protein n=1 Tax=Aureivirga marina TaxID=1182451 RepID=UPI0018C96EAE|nr:hypothetical protein [Aureivirga marina]